MGGRHSAPTRPRGPRYLLLAHIDAEFFRVEKTRVNAPGSTLKYCRRVRSAKTKMVLHALSFLPLAERHRPSAHAPRPAINRLDSFRDPINSADRLRSATPERSSPKIGRIVLVEISQHEFPLLDITERVGGQRRQDRVFAKIEADD